MDLQTAVSYTLTLTEEEAQWLKEMVQNPMCPIEQEDQRTATMRRRLWDTLESVRPR